MQLHFQKSRTSMITKAARLGAVMILIGVTALAQDSAPKMEAGIDYTYARFSPSHAYIPNSYSLNGGGGSFDYNFTKYIGFKADFQGYGSNTQNFSLPAGSTLCPRGCSGHAQANLFTYLFGPQVGLRTGKFRPYGHFLIGGAHSNAAANIQAASLSASGTPSNNAFALAFGGGIDIVLNQSGTIALRPGEFDLLWTRFNIQTGQSSQSNFQYKAGIVFNFGGR
jgi:hypothetical protein